MKKSIMLLLTFLLFCSACTSSSTLSQKATQQTDLEQQNDLQSRKEENKPQASFEDQIVLSLSDIKEIVIDGQPADWDTIPVWVEDEEGDAMADTADILALKSFQDAQNVFFMISLDNVQTENILVTLDLAGVNGEKITLEFFPVSRDAGRMGLFAQDGHFIDNLPTPSIAVSAFDSVVEYRISLAELLENAPDLVSPLILNAVNIRTFDCPDQNGCSADDLKVSNPIPAAYNIVQTDNGEILHLCQSDWEDNASQAELPVANDTISVPQGYTAKWLVPPFGFNMPIELINYQDEKYYVLSSREGLIYSLDLQGNTVPLFKVINGTSAIVDENEHIFLYDYVHGGVYDISPQGEMRRIAESRDLEWDGTSKMIYGEDGNLYFNMDTCLYKMTKSGEYSCVTEVGQQFFQFYQTRDKRLIGMGWNTGHLIDWDDFSSQKVFTLPNMDGLNYNALTSDESGNIYIAAGSQIFKVSPGYHVSLLATLETEGLSGLEWVKQTNEIIGGEHRNGGIMAVHAETGTARRLVVGNGLISPIAMAISACGEIVISNDDGNNVTLIAPDRSTHYWFEYLSYTPPTPHLLATADNYLYVTEDEVGNQGRHQLHIIPPDGVPVKSRLSEGLPDMTACGIAMDAQGDIFYTQPFDGTFNQLDGTQRRIIAEDFIFPQAFTVDAQGGFYLLVGGQAINELMPAPFSAGELYHLLPNGERVRLADAGGMDIVLSPNNDLFLTDGDSVFQVDEDGRRSQFAYGFLSPGGIVFDIEGAMIVSDINRNAVVRISGFTSGVIEGTLQDVSGKAVAGAEVRIFRVFPELAGRRVTSDSQGRFTTKAAPGSYTIQVFVDGVDTGTGINVIVVADQSTQVDISLS